MWVTGIPHDVTICMWDIFPLSWLSSDEMAKKSVQQCRTAKVAAQNPNSYINLLDIIDSDCLENGDTEN